MRFALTAVLVLAACNAGPDNGPQDLAVWTVSTSPAVEISDDFEAGEPRIGIAEGVTRLANGELVIADRGLSSLRFFSSDGTLVREVGRAGDGPGEFRYIASMRRCGDSLVVHDIARNEPYRKFATDGALGPALIFESVQSQPPYRSACNQTGMFLHMGWDTDRVSPGRVRGVTPYWIAAPNGSLHVLLGDFPGSERFGAIPHPLGREPVLALSSTRAYIGTADSFAVLSFGIDGAPGPVLRYLDTDRRTTPDDIERARFLDTTGYNASTKQWLMSMWEGVEFPSTVPAYDQMVVDVRDRLWVRRTPRRIGGSAEWIVFGTDGTPMARVTMSGEFRVHEIGDDYVLGVATNPTDGSQAVRVFTLVRER